MGSMLLLEFYPIKASWKWKDYNGPAPSRAKRTPAHLCRFLARRLRLSPHSRCFYVRTTARIWAQGGDSTSPWKKEHYPPTQKKKIYRPDVWCYMVKLANTKALKTKGCELTEGFQRCVLKTAQLRAQMPLLPPSHSSSSSLRSGSRCTPAPSTHLLLLFLSPRCLILSWD